MTQPGLSVPANRGIRASLASAKSEYYSTNGEDSLEDSRSESSDIGESVTELQRIPTKDLLSGPGAKTSHQTFLLEASKAYDRIIQEQADQEQWESNKTHLMINPDRPARLSWDLVGMFCIMYQACTVPYELAFETDESAGEVCIAKSFAGEPFSQGCVWGALNLVVDVFFALDVIINFFTGFYSKGTLVMAPHRCFVQYFRTWFVVDALGIFPWRYINAGEDDGSAAGAAKLLRMLKFLKFVRLLKLLRVMKLRSVLIKLEDHLRSEYLYVVFQLVKLCMYLLLLCHITACAWYGVAMLSISIRDEGDDYHTSWVEDHGLHLPQRTNQERYITALYFTMATMTTVGYGDISAGSFPLERAFGSFTLLMGTGVFTMLITSIAKSFQGASTQQGTGADINRVALKYMWRIGISGELTVQIRKYLQQHEESARDLETDAYLRANISQTLLHNFCLESFFTTVRRFDFFAGCSEVLCSDICRLCVRAKCAPGEVLCVEGDVADAMYFLTSGKVIEVSSQREEGDPIEELVEGQHFGEACLFQDETIHRFSVICRVFCEFVQIQKAGIIELKKVNPELKRRIHERRREMEAHMQQLIQMGTDLGYDANRLATKCGLCDRMGHHTSECPIKKTWENGASDFLVGSSLPEIEPLWIKLIARFPSYRWCPQRWHRARARHFRKRRRMQIFGVCCETVVDDPPSPKPWRVALSVLNLVKKGAEEKRPNGCDGVCPGGGSGESSRRSSGKEPRRISGNLVGMPAYYNTGDIPDEFISAVDKIFTGEAHKTMQPQSRASTEESEKCNGAATAEASRNEARRTSQEAAEATPLPGALTG